MIYDSLRKLPKVIQVEIMETGNAFLLDTDISNPETVEETQAVYLFELWSKLSEEFNQNTMPKTIKRHLMFIEN